MTGNTEIASDDATQQQPRILRPLHSAEGPQDDNLVDGFVAEWTENPAVSRGWYLRG